MGQTPSEAMPWPGMPCGSGTKAKHTGSTFSRGLWQDSGAERPVLVQQAVATPAQGAWEGLWGAWRPVRRCRVSENRKPLVWEQRKAGNNPRCIFRSAPEEVGGVWGVCLGGGGAEGAGYQSPTRHASPAGMCRVGVTGGAACHGAVGTAGLEGTSHQRRSHLPRRAFLGGRQLIHKECLHPTPNPCVGS